MPSRLAMAVAAESDPAICQAILTKGVTEALSELTHADIRALVETV
jgi:hypothetical protein